MKPIRVEPSLEFGKQLALELYSSTLDVISSGNGALELAERAANAIEKQDWQELDLICQTLKQFIEKQHAFATVLQKMLLFVYLQEPRQ